MKNYKKHRKLCKAEFGSWRPGSAGPTGKYCEKTTFELKTFVFNDVKISWKKVKYWSRENCAYNGEK